MKCPKGCDSVLVIADRGGIEIDYCPECRGVWLDRGELDKLVERQTQILRQAQPESLPGYRETWDLPEEQPPAVSRRKGRRNSFDEEARSAKRRRRHPFDVLEDLFDF